MFAFSFFKCQVCCRSSDLCSEHGTKHQTKKSQRSNLLNHSLRVFWLASLLSIFRLADQPSAFLRSYFTETPYKFTLNLTPPVNSKLKWLKHRSNRQNIFWVLVDSPVTHFFGFSKGLNKTLFFRIVCSPHVFDIAPFSFPLLFVFSSNVCVCAAPLQTNV